MHIQHENPSLLKEMQILWQLNFVALQKTAHLKGKRNNCCVKALVITANYQHNKY